MTNTCTQNYKFEGKERDAETGNDDFGARYYSSSFGRWLSPDWSAIPVPVPYANLTNPQTLNLYAMVSDNPETFADLDGHYFCNCQGIGEGSFSSWAGGGDYSEVVTDADSQPGAAQNQTSQPQQQKQQEQGATTLNLGGTSVDVTLSAAEINGGNGVTINANPQGCDNCRWAQTVTRTGDPTQPTHTDREAKSGAQPLYPPGDRMNNFWDGPNTHKGSAGGTFTAVTTLGVADTKNKTFKVLGSMTWGYKVDKTGSITPLGPRVATRAEQARSIAVLKRDSPSWTFGP